MMNVTNLLVQCAFIDSTRLHNVDQLGKDNTIFAAFEQCSLYKYTKTHTTHT
jgi:hypothetical protein